MNLSTKIANISIKSCIWNASGANCTTKKDLHELGQSQAGVILSKSCTLESRVGNEFPRYFCQENPFLTINSTGLANLGYEFYGNISEDFKKYDKPYFVSVSGLSMDDNLQIIDYLQDKVDAIELNLSCPNIVGKPQIGYDFDSSKLLLQRIFSEINMIIPLGLKLPPYFDQVHILNMSTIINEYPISFITCCNSLGNGLVIDWQNESTVIKPKNGLGGIGGSVIKAISLSNVYQFRRELRSDIAIIGCGGVRNGVDVFEHILAGANGVQVGSQLVEEGPKCFERIEKELKEIMEKKGYDKIEQFRGKLRAIN